MLKEKNRWRLAYHLMPPEGWLNDPNGLCQKDGIYHIYFQYAPDTPAPDGRKARTWGHYAGKDLLQLQFAGVPFWPEKLDRDGCYSGSALVDGGMINLYYTGNIKMSGDYDYIHDGRESNTILIRTPDGKTYGEKEFLFGTREYPAECTRHVRDPKVWKDKNLYYMVLGARLADDEGAVLLYESKNKTAWKFLRILKTRDPFGYMWECPDYFELDGKKIFSICPQGLAAEAFRFQNLYQAGYFEMTGDIRQEYGFSAFTEWDYGFDFYAPQSFTDEKGRRILIGWAGMPDHPYENPTAALGWENCLTVPRLLAVKDGVLRQNPVPELAKLRREEIAIGADGTAGLPDASADAEICFPPEAGQWQILIGKGVLLSFTEGMVTLEMDEETGCGRKKRYMPVEKVQKLRILVDRSILEFYINDGALASSSRYYPRETADAFDLTFRCPGADIHVWSMKPLPANEIYSEVS